MSLTINAKHACISYCAAVTTATLYTALVFILIVDLLPARPMLTGMAIAWGAIFVVAAAPYALVIRIANRREERSWGYFMCGGVLTALVACGLLLAIPAALACDDSSLRGPDLQLVLGFALHAAAAGAAAGTTAWAYLRRHHPIG